MWIRAHNGLAIHLKHKAQYPMCRRMLGAEVHHVVPDLGIPSITAHVSGAARRRPLGVHPIASVDRTHSAEVLNAVGVDATSTRKGRYGPLGLESVDLGPGVEQAWEINFSELLPQELYSEVVPGQGRTAALSPCQQSLPAQPQLSPQKRPPPYPRQRTLIDETSNRWSQGRCGRSSVPSGDVGPFRLDSARCRPSIRCCRGLPCMPWPTTELSAMSEFGASSILTVSRRCRNAVQKQRPSR
ncbi:hypothetical protein G6F57_010533 [Rhizopus arrhizus]|nr:hypothetical protein G6F22_007047 [Rhizopus arrhizus]KAG0962963.1 hypothetical protein G6F31_008147 [Rhizopus arrhizus]KAG1279796.1 hypothetical protein G6F65_006878 [Rhizopus arrhizus]KAG1473881.1 hypothetical protein G6F57_010533 [Rhizopus arrhizus]